jgi:hypothetical protein
MVNRRIQIADRYTDRSEKSMPIRKARFRAPQLLCFVLIAWMLADARTTPGLQNKDGQNGDVPARPPVPGADYSGMYSFLRDGEFVQITVEDQGHVTGFVSRYSDSENDRGVFLEHFFASGKLDGSQLTFATKNVQGVWYEFRGTVERGEGKSRGDEAYYALKGTLVENTTDEAKKTSSRSSEVALKSFPRDLSPPPQQPKK